ncbi:MAG: response regulator [Gemmatimonadales bacterium]|nr:response regulator [Gemmatimonadales bacterium]MBP6570491.1 response regulator [Gemmatimonadales bacterium]MBP7620290.1 response regulator [Gemmatimonadales bacterium]
MTTPVMPTTQPPRGERRRGGVGFSAWTTALLVLLGTGGIAVVADQWYAGVRSELLRESVRNEVVPTATALETSLRGRMALLHGLSSFLEIHWAKPDRAKDFDRFAEDILRDVPSVLAVQFVAPDGIITHIWPQAGNEQAVGRNLLRDARPGTVADFQRALTEPGIVVSGPTELYQGGAGLVGRLAARGPDDSVIAVAAVVVRLAPIAVEAGLENLPNIRSALVDERGALIVGDSTVVGANGRAIRASVTFAGRQWQLLAMPTDGWAVTIRERVFPMRTALAALVLLAAGLALVLVGRRDARAEAARLRGEEKFSRLFSLTPDGVALTRFADGVLLEVNEGFVELTGRSRDEVLGRSAVELKLWPTPADREAMVRAISRDGTLTDFAVALVRPDGAVRETRLAGRLVDIDGMRCVLMIIRDVTEQRKLERRLTEAARLESIGRLAGGIAHDFNNLITAISGYGHLLEARVADQPEALADVQEIVRSSARAADLTSQLLAFARRQVVQPRVVDVNALILDANRRLRQLVGDGVALSIRLSPDPAPILIDPTQGDQLLTNLAVNARDAMPEGGTLTIQALAVRDEVHMTFRDTGQGIAPEVRAHLFEPFFTTKPAGQGTGLGLATCYGIMEQAGGRIEVQSTVGEGALFRLVFPRASAEVEAAASAAAVEKKAAGGATVLVAEDEAQVRKLVDRVLTQLGYVVLSAASGAEALALDANHGGTIDMLLTDMVMPGMGGGELSRRIRERHPQMKVLLMSGYSEELVAAEHGDVPFLPKPFTPEELSTKVREVLGG